MAGDRADATQKRVPKSEPGLLLMSGGALDGLAGGLLREIAAEEDFVGKPGQTTFHRIAESGFKRVGLGKVEKATATTKVWRTLGESVGIAGKTAQVGSAAVVVVDAGNLSDDVNHAAMTNITADAVLGLFEDMQFKSEFKKPTIKILELLGLASGTQLGLLISQTMKQSTSVILAKQLVNAPPNVLFPSVMASEAEAIAAV